MSRAILLDAGIIGLVTNPRRSTESTICNRWLQLRIQAGDRAIVPEIADYEVRRELLQASKTQGMMRLDEFIELIEYLPINTAAMRQAAIFWAQARQQGKPIAADQALDGDMILAAQAVTLGVPETVIATTNVGHLSRFVQANLWQNITSS